MGKKTKLDQAPQHARGERKKDAGYFQGSKGSTYAIKNKRRDEGDLAEFAFKNAAAPSVSKPPALSATESFRNSSAAATLRQDRKKPTNPNVFETEPYNGGAFISLKILGDVIFHPIEDKALRGKSCFMFAEKNDHGFDVTRYIGFVGVDGKFRGVKEAKFIGNAYDQIDVWNGLQLWVKNNIPSMRSSQRVRLSRDATLVQTGVDCPEEERRRSSAWTNHSGFHW